MKTLLILCLAIASFAGLAAAQPAATTQTVPAALPAVAHINAAVVIETGGRRHYRRHYYRHATGRRFYYRHHRRYYY